MTTLRDLLLDSRDGEWGQGEASEDSREMSVIRGTDFEAVRVGDAAKVPVRHLATRHADRKTMRPWDILIETAGGSKDRPTGRTLLLTPSRLATFDRPVTCASFARFLRIDPSKADPQFVFWLLQDLYEQRTILQFHTQHTGVARFQFTTFADNWPLQLPALSNQRRIAGILSAYDDLIENNTRRIAILEDMARRLFEEWFVPDSATSVAPKSASQWPSRPLLELATVAYGKNLPTKGLSDDLPYPVYGAAKIIGHHSVFNFQERTILIGCRGTVGQVQITEPNCFVTNNSFSVVPIEPVAFHWLYETLRRRGFEDIRSGSAQPQITLDGMSKVSIAVPPPALVREYSLKVSPMWQLAWALADHRSRLRAARDLLLPKLISGELDVSRAEAADFPDLAIAAE